MKLAKYKACICEGSAETATLNDGLYPFTRMLTNLSK